MKTIKFKITLVALFAFVASHAQTSTAPVTEKQIQQQEIKKSMRPGEINKREARRQKARERRLLREKKAERSDVAVSRKERKKLNKEMRRTEKAVKKQEIY